MIEKKGYKTVIKVCLFSLLVLIYILTLYKPALQNDTFFDIKLGEKYLTEGIVREDNFSIHNDLEYIAQHLGVNIITYLVYKNFGYFGLYILGIMLSSILAVMLYQLNKEFLKTKTLSYILLFFEIFFLQSFLAIRAQMYSYIIFALEILLIQKFIKSNKKIYLAILSVIPLLLINIHAGVIWFYFIILLVYYLNILRIKVFKIECDKNVSSKSIYLLIPVAVGAFLMFLNPFGIDAVIYGFKTLSNEFINQYIMEFQPFSIKNTYGVMITIYVSIFLFSFMFTKLNIKLQHFLLFFGTLFMTLLSIRHFSLLIICSITCLPYIEEIFERCRDSIYNNMMEKGKKYIKITVRFVIVCLLIRTSANSMMVIKEYSFVPKSTYPVEAIEYIKDNIGSDKRIFNEYTWGSLMMLNDIKVFIDSRADLYTKEYSKKEDDIAMDYIRINNCTGNYIDLLNKYNIDYIFIEKSSNLAKNILEHDEYKMMYEDEISYIIEKVN